LSQIKGRPLRIRAIMRHFFIICVLLASQCPTTSHADEAAPSVELHWRDRQIKLSEAAQQQLCKQAERLVHSSNFHSDPGDTYHLFTISGVQGNYRREVAGRFLLISFPTPKTIRTLSDEITVTEIVVGLNRNDYASNLFTIDDAGRVIGHSKYAGEICIEIFNTVKQLTQ